MPPAPVPSSTDISLQPSVASLSPPPPPPPPKPSLPELKASSSSPTTSRSRITRSAGKEGERGAMDTKRYNSGDSNKRKNHTNDTSSLTNVTTERTNKTEETKNKDTTTTTRTGPTDKPVVARVHTGQIWEGEIKPLLDRLDPKATTSSDLTEACTEVWRVLENHSLLGKGLGGKRRSVLLKSLFALLGHKEPKLLLILAKIILAVRTK